METVVLSALLAAIVIFLWLGISLGKHNKTLSDVFPILFGKRASVNNVSEFSSSTTATTVSLATIVLAYFQLAGFFGLWLEWTAVTTAIGMWLVSIFGKRIWLKMAEFEHRPTLHEYLSVEFHSKSILFVGAICTSLGYLLIFATELIVGSTFLSSLIPQIPSQITVIILSMIGVTYVIYGGFRSVIKTDQLQMKFIWGFVIALSIFFIWYCLAHGGFTSNLSKIPANVYNFANRPGLWIFLLGVTVMNIPTHISSMAIWQRIAGTQNIDTVSKGLRNSIYSISSAWGLIVIMACLSFMIIPTPSDTLLPDLLKIIGITLVGKVLLFFVVIGMYAALLSTSSTNLVAVGQTISEDILARFRKLSLMERDKSKSDFLLAKIILLASAIFAVLIVVGLKKIGYDIKDLVFSIYGSALALFPPILFSLLLRKETLKKLSVYASLGIIFGFFFGWGATMYGKLTLNNNLIFLAPVFSIGASLFFLMLGIAFKGRK